jgi:predicted cobalt transporter CbtA
MLGALLTILAPKINGAQKPDVQSAESTEEMLHKWVNSTTNAMKDEILRVRTAVYGGWGGNEFVDIPESFLLPGSS